MTDPSTPPPDPAAEVAERHARILKRMVEVGANLVEDIELQRQQPDTDAADLALKYHRVTRALRQTMYFEKALVDGVCAAAEEAAKAAAPRKVGPIPNYYYERIGEERRTEAVKAVRERLRAEKPDFDEEDFADIMADWRLEVRRSEPYADRPLDDIIAEIGRYLDLNPEPKPYDSHLDPIERHDPDDDDEPPPRPKYATREEALAAIPTFDEPDEDPAPPPPDPEPEPPPQPPPPPPPPRDPNSGYNPPDRIRL